MTETEFDHGYWYATELKAFAVTLGIPSASRLRKDELEAKIKHFLRTGEIDETLAPPPRKSVPRDSDQGLQLDLPIVRYTNNTETKAFILRECQRIDPDFEIKSGTRYLLNRWREARLRAGDPVTYGDLVKQFIEINRTKDGPLRTSHGRYNNFYADFMAAHPGATHRQITEAWNTLKTLDIPKTYAAWRQHHDQTG